MLHAALERSGDPTAATQRLGVFMLIDLRAAAASSSSPDVRAVRASVEGVLPLKLGAVAVLRPPGFVGAARCVSAGLLAKFSAKVRRRTVVLAAHDDGDAGTLKVWRHGAARPEDLPLGGALQWDHGRWLAARLEADAAQEDAAHLSGGSKPTPSNDGAEGNDLPYRVGARLDERPIARSKTAAFKFEVARSFDDGTGSR
jgi:hypothetical protein